MVWASELFIKKNSSFERGLSFRQVDCWGRCCIGRSEKRQAHGHWKQKNKWHMPHVSVIYQSWTYYSDSKATRIRTVEKFSVVVKFTIGNTIGVKDILYNVLSI